MLIESYEKTATHSDDSYIYLHIFFYYLHLIYQQLYDEIGFVGCTNGDTGSHEAPAGTGIPGLVATDIEVTGDFFRLYIIAVSISSHPRCRNDVFVRALFQYGVDQHGFGVGIVKGFADDPVVSKKLRNVFFVETDAVRPDIDERVDIPYLPCQGIGLIRSQVTDHVGLAIQVAGIDGIEIEQMEMTDSRTGQIDGSIGTKAPQSTDSDVSGAYFVMDPGRMTGAHHGFQCIPGWQPVFWDKIDFIAFMKGQIITGGKSIYDCNFPSGPAGCCQGRQTCFFTGIRFSIEYNMQLNAPHSHIKNARRLTP